MQGGAIGADNTFSFGGRTDQLNYAANVDGGTTANDVTITDVTSVPGGGGGTPGPPPGDDNLAGTGGPDTVALLAGNDTYSGGDGSDLI